MNSTPIHLTRAEHARIEANALAGAFDDHRQTMDPTWPGDLAKEKQLHAAASKAERTARHLEAASAQFRAHADAAIDVTGGQR